MTLFNHHIAVLLIAVMCHPILGCSPANDEQPVATGQTESKELSRARVLLDDGVYPVLLGDEALPKRDPGIKIRELVSLPVKGSGNSGPEKIRVIDQPLLHFRDVSQFDFAFEKNECTEVGFQNTDELKAYTRDHVGSRLAVVIDNRVISHHKIREPIETNQVRITCCTVGGGDHLHLHLKELKRASDANRPSKVID
jgi:hypothetical protein